MTTPAGQPVPISGDAKADPHAPSKLPQWVRMVPLPRKHWTPRYVVDRIKLALYQRRNPDHPWLTRDMIDFLSGHLSRSHTLVEFGSGRSTIWFAQRVGHILSIEHHREWHASVTGKLNAAGFKNFTYVHAGDAPETYLAPATESLARLDKDGKADLILVDGIHRDHCALWALDHVRPGGIIMVDNVNWFLPHATKSPSSVGAGGKPHTAMWERFWAVVSRWEMKWTSNGITDTAAFFAPK